MKRGFDLIVAVPALLAAAPLLLILGLAVRWSSPGPAFFSHQRLGRHRRLIRVFKLRTMVEGAERQGPQVTAKQDARITPLGAWLRQTKLDELPQLWNVVRGDMSLVGPRPESPRYIESSVNLEWDHILSVRPGLTDIASIVFRHEESLLAEAVDRERAYLEVVLPAKIALAREGVENSSLLYDLKVMVRTLGAVLHRQEQSEHPVLRATRQQIQRFNRSIA